MLKRNYGFFLAILFVLGYVPFIQRYGFGLVNEDSADFPSFYFGAKLAFIDHKSPYEAENLREIFQEYTENNGDYYPYLYAPPSLVFFMPFTLFSYRDARLVMLILNHLLLFVFIYLLLFKILGLNFSSFLPAIFTAYIFLFDPLRVTLDNGQVNIIVLTLICFAWYMEKEEKHPFWIALPLSLAILLKLYPILFLIPLFFGKQYKVIGYVLLTVLVFSVIISFFLPETTWQTWYANVESKGYTQDVLNLALNAPANQSMLGFFLRTFFGKNIRFAPLWIVPKWVSTIAPYIASGVVISTSLLITCLLNRARSLPSLSKIDMNFSLWSLVIFLVAPVSWDHHLVFLLPAAVVWVSTLLKFKEKKYIMLLGMAILTAFVLAFPYPYNSPEFRIGRLTLLISVPLYFVGFFWLQLILFILFQVWKNKNLVRENLPKRES